MPAIKTDKLLFVITMNKIILSIFSILLISVTTTSAQQIEQLTRGAIAVKMSKSEGQKKNGIFISWRYLDNDKRGTTFNVYRNGKLLNSQPLSTTTNYTDLNGDTSAQYVIETLVNDTSTARDTVKEIWSNIYKEIKLDRPAAGITPAYTVSNNKVEESYPNGQAYSYSPNDCSTADVDGDGEYEIVVKWDPSNSRDNSLRGYTGNVYLDCYELDGTKLWRIDLGQNIRAGAHYTQFMVYDLDGDGKAEVACKTAPGTKDGQGKYVLMGNDDPNTDYRETKTNAGIILKGPEYLTVFNGETGAEITTVSYNPLRGTVSSWGDSYGNRVDRFLACIAYLDGMKPSLVMCRGYYTRSALVAYDFDGKTLKQRWIHDSASSGKGAYGQGNHNLSVGDVDNDGYDEIIYGACAIDHDGTLLYRTGLGHGDALHLSDIDPDIDGLELFTPHEEKTATYGFDMHNAATGEILYGEYTGTDVGRGMAADIDTTYRGLEFWSTGTSNVYTCKGDVISTSRPSVNFRIYWDGDLQDELLDGNKLDKWNKSKKKSERLFTLYNYGSASSCNSTKATPCLQADILGDWREEVILWNSSDSSSLVIFTTTHDSPHRIVTPMQDHVYRMGIAWQNVAYNQPPHLGYYIGDGSDLTAAKLSKIGIGTLKQSIELGETIVPFGYSWENAEGIKVIGNLPTGITAKIDQEQQTIMIEGTPEEVGTFDYTLTTYGSTTDASISGYFEIRKPSVIEKVAHYTFDEQSGNTATNSIHGEATAYSLTPEWVSGVSGNAITFDGNGGYMKQSHYDRLNMSTGAFSITLWFKSSGGSGIDWYLFHKGSHSANSETGATGNWIGIQYRNDKITFGIDDNATKTNLDVAASDYFDDEWHFLACVRDSLSKQIIMYIDGEQVGNTTDKTGNIFESEDIVIGNRNVLFDNSYRGALDELEIYTGALSVTKIYEMYKAGKPGSGLAETPLFATARIKVYPTTIDEQTTIILREINNSMVNFSIHNLSGIEVYNHNYFIEGGESVTISGLSHLPSGMYTLTITTPDNQFSRKLLKK